MSLKVDTGSLYKLEDLPATADPYYKDYESTHMLKATALVIDNGSDECRAGWAGEEKPRLIFRNALAKTRGKKGEADGVCVGNDITHVEAVRSTLKNQFDRNVVTNFSCQEQILDYTFSRLGIVGEGCVPHPVVMTEPVCNPAYSRSQMTELLFECYGIPSLTYGIDALFSAYHSYSCHGEEMTNALIVSSGHQATHILPVLDGRLDSTHCKRVNLGGMQTVGYLQRVLQLKYPDLQNFITLSRAKEILYCHSYVPLDYREELKKWATPTHAQELDYRSIQLPFNQAAHSSMVTDLSRELKDKQRRQKAREQLLKLNKRKREAKIAGLLKELSQHFELRGVEGNVDPEEYQLLLEEAGYNSEESLSLAISNKEAELEAEQDKLTTLVKNLSEGASPREPCQEESVSEEWLQSLKERRKEILEAKRQRQLKKTELGKRRSAASQNRMRLISNLGAEVASAKRGKRGNEDTFGMDDEDWNVYRAIDKHAEDSDSEKEESELLEIIKVLDKHDPSYMRSGVLGQVSPADIASSYQLVLGVERFRTPEIIFHPPMVGVDQCGVSETMEFVLQYYPPDIQQRLVQNVFITGGNTLHANFLERLESELCAMRPFQSSFRVKQATDPVLDAWRGGGAWANTHPAGDEGVWLTKEEYTEKGSEYMKEHTTSNQAAGL